MKLQTIILLMLIPIKSFSAPTSEQIIGSWCESGPNIENCSMVETFFKNGTVIAKGVLLEYGIKYEAEGTWELKGQNICIDMTIQNEFNIETGKKIERGKSGLLCNKMITINEKVQIYKDLSTGTIHTLYRIK